MIFFFLSRVAVGGAVSCGRFQTPSARCSLLIFVGVFISAVVERRNADHVDITEEQSEAAGILEDNCRMSLDFSSIPEDKTKDKILICA